jgi:hypothetical protein
MMSKGRKRPASGEKNGMTILTEDEVRAIRNRYVGKSRKDGARAIAKEYNVSPDHIVKIVLKTRRKHVD